MELVKLTLATVLAVLLAALLATLAWPNAIFLILAGLVVAAIGALWFQRIGDDTTIYCGHQFGNL